MEGVDYLIIVIKVVAAFALLLVATLLLVWMERKVVADMQNRIGPDRAGPFGILQTVADGLKLFFKEQITPRKVELGMYLLAPTLAVLPAFLIFLVVPIGRPITVAGREVALQATDLNVGLLYILAFSSVAVYAVVLAGWSSGSKYPLLGGVRATAQAISYEAAMGLSLVAVVMWVAGNSTDIQSMSLAGIVEYQQQTQWLVIPMLPAFAIFLVAAFAETNRAPFDLVEAEQELVGGFHTEYSGLRFALFFLAEYINMFNMSAIATTVFLGGWAGPTFDSFLPSWAASLLPVVYFLVKTFLILFLFMWIRATLPRLRYDQLMTLGWKRLIPLALSWLIIATAVVAVRQFGMPWT